MYPEWRSDITPTAADIQTNGCGDGNWSHSAETRSAFYSTAHSCVRGGSCPYSAPAHTLWRPWTTQPTGGGHLSPTYQNPFHIIQDHSSWVQRDGMWNTILDIYKDDDGALETLRRVLKFDPYASRCHSIC
ncbi:uncharacterized protein LOC124546001 [Schistocerca americana]|uniref:uncharacterized protein LOC124546001 n=1 Tax=Schistocerca americana TaxID=7009 RepID=UPI001F4FC47E|nr:uncharacterized protein LOC124546001 [Schistocerca americana]